MSHIPYQLFPFLTNSLKFYDFNPVSDTFKNLIHYIFIKPIHLLIGDSKKRFFKSQTTGAFGSEGGNPLKRCG